jgi:hypothetical protein
MNALILGLGAAIFGTGAHALTLRHLAPRWRLSALPVVLLISFVGLLFVAPLHEAPLTFEDCAVALILALSLGAAYAFTLVGVLYDSPTLALINAIESHKPAGMPTTGFDAFVAKHPFLQSRLDALIAAGELGVDGRDFLLTGKAAHLLRLGDGYRSLRNASSSTTG